MSNATTSPPCVCGHRYGAHAPDCDVLGCPCMRYRPSLAEVPADPRDTEIATLRAEIERLRVEAGHLHLELAKAAGTSAIGPDSAIVHHLARERDAWKEACLSERTRTFRLTAEYAEVLHDARAKQTVAEGEVARLRERLTSAVASRDPQVMQAQVCDCFWCGAPLHGDEVEHGDDCDWEAVRALESASA